MSDLANLEANYRSCVNRLGTDPSKNRLRELAKKQIIIDGERCDQRLPRRWYTYQEVIELGTDPDNWPSEPREPIALGEFLSDSDPEAWKELPTMVRFEGQTTMTLDTLLKKLLELRETVSGQMPVVVQRIYDYEECLTNISNVEARDDCIVFDNI